MFLSGKRWLGPYVTKTDHLPSLKGAREEHATAAAADLGEAQFAVELLQVVVGGVDAGVHAAHAVRAQRRQQRREQRGRVRARRQHAAREQRGVRAHHGLRRALRRAERVEVPDALLRGQLTCVNIPKRKGNNQT